MPAALPARVRGLALAAAFLTTTAGGVVLTPSTASAVEASCTAMPGVVVTVSGGHCTRHVVPFPTDYTSLPAGSPIPADVYPARQLADDEQPPNVFTDPERRAVWYARPDGSIAIYSPRPESQPVPDPSLPPAPQLPPSAPVLPPVDAVTPAAPTAVTALPGNARATVRWTAPLAGSGAAVTHYTVTVYRAGVPLLTSGNWTGTTATVGSLKNGVAYTVTVTAHSAAGLVAESAPSPVVTPSTVPGAPQAVAARPGNASLQVSWRAPSANGGRALTGYTVRAYRGTTLVRTVAAPAGAQSATVSGLVNGTGYTVTVTATNQQGAGAASARSAVIVPGTRPSAPRIGVVTPANGAAVVRWTAPANGGRAISSYTVRVYSGNALIRTTVVSPRATSVVVPKLTNGTRLSFTVSATNAFGAGPASARSTVVTPRR